MSITTKERERIRELAKIHVMHHNSEDNLKKAELWFKHNTFRGERPMIHIELGTFEGELIPQLLECESDFARGIEASLIRNFYNFAEIRDDKVVPPYYGVGLFSYMKPLNMDVKVQHTGGLGHQFIHAINDLEEDFHKIQDSVFFVNEEDTNKYQEQVEDLIGDILPTKRIMNALYAVPTQDIVHLMGMENMFTAMYDYPDLFKQMMQKVTDGYIKYYKHLEENNYLLPTVGYEWLGQGMLCFTDELPSSGKIKTTDMWGYMDSQETVGISLDMFSEFIFPYYKQIADIYGLLSYGCCEPVDVFWPRISEFTNLRKVSVSAWCNEEYIAEQLKNRKVLYARKPSPNYLGVGENLDEEAFREHIMATVRATGNKNLEIIQRDVYTVNRDIEKVRRYVEIIRECTEN